MTMLPPLSFTAKPIAQYNIAQKDYPNRKNRITKPMTVYKLEQKDMPALKTMMNKANFYEFFPKQEDRIDQEGTFMILRKGLKQLMDFFKSDKDNTDRIGLLATADNRPVGLISGAIPQEPSKEADIGYLVSWTNTPKTVLKGVGSALMAEFCRLCRENSTDKSIYLESTLDGLSLYKAFSFTDSTKKGDNSFNDKPMRATAKSTSAKIEQIAEHGNRKALEGKSIPLQDFLDLNYSYEIEEDEPW